MTRPTLLRIVAVVSLLAAAGVSLWFLRGDEARQQLIALVDRVREWGFAGALAVAALYVPACVLAVPGWPLTLAAGFALGPVVGTAAVSLGSTVGATAAFLVGRTIARGWIESRVADSPRFRAIDEAVGREGFKIVLLTRLSPVFPFNVLNYAYGLTRVRLRDYVLASWIGMFPATLLYVYLGSAIQNIADLAAGRVAESPWQRVLFFVGLAATILVTVVLTRVARRALDKATRMAPPGE